MTSSDALLRRHLGWVVALKLIALIALWWFCVRDAGLHVDPSTVLRQFAPNPIAQGVPRGQ
ncbi:cytochrome oxidase putative small subunit CydP [Zoogloea dura]|uniref:Uncharacterized protein n=1 Tax=Zoogloea dura TaxID=2728840 RepID=A0A848GCG5_9RHOO|nr:cytochrome oxidase putative small subunit CydP [Zoogloea dura]NML28436.1 hypothetical protein [Zoogloea dura]